MKIALLDARESGRRMLDGNERSRRVVEAEGASCFEPVLHVCTIFRDPMLLAIPS
jgi:hypothetical protein